MITYSRKSKKKNQLIHTSTGERGFQDYVLTKKSQLIHTLTDKQGFEFTNSCKIPVDLYINCRIRQTRFSNLVKPSWSQINGRPEIACIKVTPPRNYRKTFSEIKTNFCWTEKTSSTNIKTSQHLWTKSTLPTLQSLPKIFILPQLKKQKPALVEITSNKFRHHTRK